MKIKLHILFGSKKDKSKKVKSPAPYNPQNDPGYKEAASLLQSLASQFAQSAKKLTYDELMASMPEFQRNIIAAQNKPTVAAPTANWGAINNLQQQAVKQGITPTYAPQFQGSFFSGVNPVTQSNSTTPNQNFVYQLTQLGKGAK